MPKTEPVLRSAAEMRQVRADATKESSIERHFIMRAKQYGCRQRKLTQYYAEEGWPDRLLVWRGPGVTDFPELKRPKGGKLEPRQKTILADLIACGCTCPVLHTKEAVDAYFASRAKQLGVRPVVPLTKRRTALREA
jgi:hypothetical protein